MNAIKDTLIIVVVVLMLVILGLAPLTIQNINNSQNNELLRS